MSERNKVPQFMQNGIDFKKAVASYFYGMIDMAKNGELDGITIGEKTNVKILTNFGTIDGRAIYFDEASEGKMATDDSASFLYASVIKAVDMTMADQEAKIGSDNLRVINQTGRLVLADAVVTPYANPSFKFNYTRLLVFTDQIVGITFGEETHL